VCVSAVSDVMSDKGDKESDKADNLEDILDEDDDNVDQEAVAKELDEAGEEAIDALLEDDDDDVEDKEAVTEDKDNDEADEADVAEVADLLADDDDEEEEVVEEEKKGENGTSDKNGDDEKDKPESANTENQDDDMAEVVEAEAEVVEDEAEVVEDEAEVLEEQNGDQDEDKNGLDKTDDGEDNGEVVEAIAEVKEDSNGGGDSESQNDQNEANLDATTESEKEHNKSSYTDPVAQLMDLKSPESEKKTTKATSNGGDSDIEMLDDDGNTAPPSSNKAEKKGNKKAVSDVIDLSSDEAQEPEEEEEEESEEESEDDETGDPSKPPGEGSEKTVDPDHLMPFHHGWRREVVMRLNERDVKVCDIYYIPPEDQPYRTREAKRKRRSKQDQEQYFEDFPHKSLAIQHFCYVRRPLGINNAAYEIVRKARKREKEKENAKGGKGGKKGKTRYTEEPINHSSDNESDSADMDNLPYGQGAVGDDDDNEVAAIFGFNMKLPLCLQVTSSMEALKEERKKRRKFRDPETACTPPLAEDMLWSALDDDPLGVHTELGGRSSPCTPPPLRAVKLTPNETAEKITGLINDVKAEAAKKPPPFKHAEGVIDNLATHDYKIRKFKNVKPMKWSAAFAKNASQQGQYRPQQQHRKGYTPQQQFNHHSQNSSLLGSPGIWEKMRNLKGVSVSQGGKKSSKGYAGQEESGSVKVKLPLAPVNGKRPNVELVMLQNGKYRPIKFSNNMTVTEIIPKRLFNQANTLRKTIYQRARQIPRVGNKPIYLAVNPTNPATGNALRTSPQKPAGAPGGLPTDQVSILVRQASNVNAKPVLLNVPRKVAIKVKKGTTLSFSASNDQKYVVVDNKIHPPLRNEGSGGGSRHLPQQPRAQQNSYNSSQRPIHRPTNFQGNNRMASSTSSPTSIAASYQRAKARMGGQGVQQVSRPMQARQHHPGLPLPRNLPGGLSISRTSNKPSAAAAMGRIGGASVLSTGEVVGPGAMAAMGPDSGLTPCTPYCPGVTGFPELECRGCQSLFHGKCVGISQSVIQRVQGTWMCRMCQQMSLPPSQQHSAVQRGHAAVGHAPPVIDLD